MQYRSFAPMHSYLRTLKIPYEIYPEAHDITYPLHPHQTPLLYHFFSFLKNVRMFCGNPVGANTVLTDDSVRCISGNNL